MTENKSLFSKALAREAELTKEEIYDILFYLKEIFGALIGVLIALIGITGLPGIIAFAIAISLLSYLYVFKYLGVDEEVVETKDVLKEHFMNGFFPFMLSWIVTYNLINFS
jgi:hypothetical protein